MKMNLIYFISFLLILTYNQANANEEYFKKSILLALKEKNGQFTSQIKSKEENKNVIYDDKYSFKLDIGEHVRKVGNDAEIKNIYLNSTELYTIMPDIKICESKFFNESILFTSINTVPAMIFNEKLTYSILGPNILFEVLLENVRADKKSVECVDEKDAKKKNPKKCTLTIKDQVKLEYHFVDNDQYTMIPDKIVVSEKKKDSKDWKIYRQLDYVKFVPSFDDKPILNSSLPVGFGCKRINSINYPSIVPFFGYHFETDLNISMSQIHPTQKGVKVSFSATAKINLDLNSSLIMVDVNSKSPEVSVKAMIDLKDKMIYALIAPNLCFKISGKSEKMALKLAKIEQELTKNIDKTEISYLGEYNVGDVPCFAFEYRDEINQTEIDKTKTHSVDLPDTVISTYYMPKDVKYWSTSDLNLKVPKLSEIVLLSYSNRTEPLEFAKVKINYESFNSKPKAIQKFDTSKCTEKTLD